QRVLENRKQAIEEERDQRRLVPETEDGNGQRQHRDGRKSLAYIHETARKRQEFRALPARDENRHGDGKQRRTKGGQRHQSQMLQGQRHQVRAVIDDRGSRIDERAENRLEKMGPRQKQEQHRQKHSARNEGHEQFHAGRSA